MSANMEQPKADPQTVSEITRILGQELEGAEATAAMMPLIYDELRRLAAYRLSQEKPGQTLQATALVNEVYLRLVKDANAHWENKRHFFGAAAEAMRRVLIESARRKKRQKRGGGWKRTAMEISDVSVNDPSSELLQIHEVLDQLAKVDAESAEIVKLRYFVGLTQQQCADIIGISKRTADNRWAFARTWLLRAVQDEERQEEPV